MDVEMYHPALQNVRHEFPFESIEAWESRGWVLVDGTAPTPEPVDLTPALGDLRYLKLGDVATPGTTTGDALMAAYVAAAIAFGTGIDPTGVADSSSAVQAKVNALTAGGTVHFPAGTYKVGNVALPSNVSLTFDRGATIKVAGGADAFTATGTIGSAITLANTADHQAYVDAASGTPFAVGQILFIEGSPTNGASALPWTNTAFAGKTSQIRRVVGVASSGGRALLDGPVYVDQSAPTAEVITPVSNVRIVGAAVVATDGTSRGLLNATYTDGVVVRDCAFAQVGANTSGGVTLAFSRGATVEGNTFDRSPYAAVFTYKCTDIRVARNRITGASGAFSFMARFLNAVEHRVTDNQCTRSRFIATASTDNIDGLTFDNDTVAPSNLANTISGNTVHNGGFGAQAGNGRGAIHVHCGSYNLVSDNQTSGGDFGIYFPSYAARNKVMGNRCNGHHGYYGVGVEFDSTVQRNLIIGNDCSRNGAALPLDPGSTISTLDSLTTTEGHGIELRTSQYQHTVQGNVCVGNAGSGIAFINAGGSGIVTGNVCLSNAGSGVIISGASNGYQVIGNDLEFNTVAAVTTEGGAFGVTQANNLT